MWKIFDQPWTVLVFSVFALMVILMLRRLIADKRLWYLWLVPVVLGGIGFALDFFVETDLEKIKSLLTTAVKAAENEDADAIEALIAESYSDSLHRSKSALMRHCRRRLDRPLFEKTVLRFGLIEMAGDSVSVIFTVRIVFDKSSFAAEFKQGMLTQAKLEAEKQPDKTWLISRLELRKIDLQPADWRTLP